MKKAIIALATFACVTSVGAVAQAADNYGTITVNGHASQSYTPDQAIVNVTVRTENASLEAAKQENDQKSATFRNSIADLGLDGKVIKTNNYSVNDRVIYLDPKDQSKTKTVYEVINSMAITLNDPTKASVVIDRAANAGITEARLGRVEMKEKDQMNESLLYKAAANARKKADALAEALGTKVIGVEAFNVDNGGYRPMMMRAASMEKSYGGSKSEITYGENENAMDVTVVFKVK